MQLVDVPQIKEGLIHIKDKYPHIAGLCPDPLLSIKRSTYDDDFQGLIRIVTGQQVSTKAAESIWQKLLLVLGHDFNAADVLQYAEDDLRACGLSGRKVEYICGASRAVVSGELDFEKLRLMDDEAIAEKIIALKGFGRWSVDMFMLFGLGRGNVWAMGDLGVRMGLQIFLSQDDRPSDDQMHHYRQVFAPFGSAASLLMWHIKHHEKK